MQRTTAGGVAVNDTVMQFAQVELPFGGIGPSGMGQYHGHQGFLTFSKQKSGPLSGALDADEAYCVRRIARLADFIVKFLTR